MKTEKAIRVLSFWEALFKDYHDKQLKGALQEGIGALEEKLQREREENK